MATRKSLCAGSARSGVGRDGAGRLREVAERFGVSQAYVSRVRSRHGRLGQTSAGAQHNHVPLRLAALREPLLAQVGLAPEQTLAQVCQWVRAEHGLQVGATTMAMGKTLARLGLTRKKRQSMPANKSEATLSGRVRTGPLDKLCRPAGG